MDKGASVNCDPGGRSEVRVEESGQEESRAGQEVT